MNKQQAKEKIKKLVERYEKLSEQEKTKYNEQQTKDHFIRPLFEILGWDFEHDVWPETDVSGKRVDYAVKIDGITKFFIEAKAISVNLEEERWAEQAINYSYHQSVPWVILTDFEGIKVFNTEWDEPDIQSCQFIELRYTEFLENEKLWWLSKEGFLEGLLDKKAEEFGRKPKKTPVDELLAQDLVRWRDCLYHNLEAYNSGKIDKIKIAEYVQTILNRLIFIRTLEEKGYEDHLLDPLVKNWDTSKNQKIALALNKIFRKIDKDYDSGLFEEGNCDRLSEKLEYDDEVFINVIKELYYNSKKIRYKFDQIPSDIFGSIYEQYLGHIQQTGKQEKKSSKRKSQGIYYTPRYIVDYIVQNTLGEVLKEKSPEQIRDIKILDPACGSGSFLIHAYQKLLDYWQEAENKKFAKAGKTEKLWKQKAGYAISTERKMRILLDNIYGVDLDEEAVEIARLNLLLKMVGKKMKLPNLDGNIENGNSLISGKEEELKEYFGKNWKEKKPFNWQEKFEPVFKRGGFDVIIGNPPYVGWAKGKQSREEKDYYESAYKEIYSGKNDLFYYFIYVSLNMLKENGRFSFIVSRYFLESIWANKLRNYISQNFYIDSIIDFRDNLIFDDAGVHACILTIVKKKEFNKNILVKLNNLNSEPFYINQEKLIGEIWMLNNDSTSLIIKKIEKKSESILNYFDIKDTKLSALDSVYILKVGQVEELGIEKEYLRKFISSKDINRFFCNDSNKFIIDITRDTKVAKDTNLYKYLKSKESLIDERNVKRKENLGWGLARPMDKYNWDKNKIFCPSRSVENRFIIDKNNSTGSRHNITVLFPKANLNLYYFLALLNSKLCDFYYKKISKKMGNSYEYLPQYLEKLKILLIKKDDTDLLSRLAKKICEEKIKLQKLDPIMDDKEYNEIKEEIEKTDKEIDKKVYELYGLNKEEIEIVENSNKR
ncbi:MAG: N-6 DNA methylase [bacterium]|nr:N-6 DNA methylase [bacterium]